MKKPLSGLVGYLKDWKNLLGHALLGVILVLISLVLPIPLWARIIVFVVLVAFNILREKFFSNISRKKPATDNAQ